MFCVLWEYSRDIICVYVTRCPVSSTINLKGRWLSNLSIKYRKKNFFFKCTYVFLRLDVVIIFEIVYFLFLFILKNYIDSCIKYKMQKK